MRRLFIAYRNTHGNMLLVSVAFSAAILVPKIPLFGGLFKQKRRTLTRCTSLSNPANPELLPGTLCGKLLLWQTPWCFLSTGRMLEVAL